MSTTLTKNRAPKLALTARVATQDGSTVIAFLKHVMEDKSEPTPVRMAAGLALLDRGYGKAPVEIHVEVEQTLTLQSFTMQELLAAHKAMLALQEPVEVDSEVVGGQA